MTCNSVKMKNQYANASIQFEFSQTNAMYNLSLSNSFWANLSLCLGPWHFLGAESTMPRRKIYYVSARNPILSASDSW